MPVFCVQGSNESFVQNLDRNGRVSEFVTVNPATLFRAGVNPPSILLEEGYPGVLAFVDDDNNLFIAQKEVIIDRLAGVTVSNPFVELELAALLSDRQRQIGALEDCQIALSPYRHAIHWTKRELSLFRVAEDSADRPAGASEYDDKFEQSFAEIANSFDLHGWPIRWLALWGQNFRRRDLVGLAALRYDQGYSFNRDGPAVFAEMLEFDSSDFVAQRALGMLSDSSTGARDWLALAYKLANRRYTYRDQIISVAYERLIRDMFAKDVRERVWINVLSFLYWHGFSRDKLWNASVEYVERSSSISSIVAEELIFPLWRAAPYFEPFEAKVARWLISTPRSTVAWSGFYVELVGRQADSHIVELGIKWLERLGGNLSTWVDVWDALEGFVSSSAHRELAFSWLERCKWNMHAWVNTFLKLMESSSLVEKQRLYSLGAAWMQSGYGSLRNRKKIEKATTYLENVLSI